MCVRACVRMCVFVCLRVCVCACDRESALKQTCVLCLGME